ncbi:beta-galactosidase [Candidatus Pacearchaeota archaeon]|nr:beta-galactosidase [Candidatus Pacearchaeota archaeon]
MNLKIKSGFALVLILISMLVFVSKLKAMSCYSGQNYCAKKMDFTVEKDKNGKFWFVDPAGKSFLSMGINNITPSAWNPKAGTQYYDAVNSVFGGDFNKWKKTTDKILKDSGFNTYGCWSDPNLHDDKMYGTVCLYVVGYANERCLDCLRPGFEDRVRQNTEQMLSRYKNLDNVIGLFLDNEMAWYGKSGWDIISNYTLLEVAIELEPDDPAHKAAKQFLIDRYNTPENFSKAWGEKLNSWNELSLSYLRSCLNDNTQKDRDDFTEFVAQKFFSVSTKIVRQIAPGKLILGVRFAKKPPEAVIKQCGIYCDVISFNDYQISPEPDGDMLTEYFIHGQKKPLMVTEYSWRAEENQSGNPNTRGAGTVVKTQAERTDAYRRYVSGMISHPMIVGAHWFEFADQSPQGRFDGENSNYGIIDIYHKPYKQLLEAMKETNSNAVKIHSGSLVKLPDKLPVRPEVIFEVGQHPEKPPLIDLIKENSVAEPEIFKAPDASLKTVLYDGLLELSYDTGQAWGCGIVFFGPKKYALENANPFATDLDGYSIIEFDAEFPENATFDFLIDEAGVGAPGLEKYDTRAGDDGESFIFKTQFGKGGRHKYRFELKNLLPRPAWGNQKGKRRVNINAIKGTGIYLHGGQGSGTIKIHSLKYMR